MARCVNFKIGDRVKILYYATIVGVESEDVGKIGVITSISSRPQPTHGIMVKMDEICKVRNRKCKWSIGYEMVELCPIKGQQLEFSFMSEVT